ncbi:MAG: hypothetical protein QXP01_04300, partial [Candidatus Hadarchaeum sp.]
RCPPARGAWPNPPGPGPGGERDRFWRAGAEKTARRNAEAAARNAETMRDTREEAMRILREVRDGLVRLLASSNLGSP